MTVTDRAGQVWLGPEDVTLEEFRAVVEVSTRHADYPRAAWVQKGILGYDATSIPRRGEPGRRELQAELVRAFQDGPGIVVLQGAFSADVVDRASTVYRQIIDEQHAAGGAAGDHFAKAGANDRVWNSLEKLAVRDPATFLEYFSNDAVAMASEAWLGPAYQVTAQVNLVHPGGQAQVPHRDYHLGFMSAERAAQWPGLAHALSPVLTLQGAIAHVDVPLESGPTFFVPHSQKYLPGYIAATLPAIAEYAREHSVQLPLSKGDLVFFNPAVFHGAGTNVSSDISRLVNLLQVGSAFGRSIETVDRTAVTLAIYPSLLARVEAGSMPDDLVANAIAASAEGYPFPTNLDRDQPIGGMAPPSQADLVTLAVSERWTVDALARALADQEQRRRTS